jgi:hypothetical protein
MPGSRLYDAEFNTDILLNVFEAVDVIALIKGGDYEALQLSVGEALRKRPAVSPCPVSSIFSS